MCRMWGQKVSQKESKGAPMDPVATDITVPFPTSDSGSYYILEVQDEFSKWVEKVERKTLRN